MKKVIIAEKPSVAKNIADAFSIRNRNDGYFEGENYIITWAFGHLLQLYDARDYDESMKGWKLERFPFIPEEFKYKIKSNSKNKLEADPGAQKQIGIIKHLINREDVDGVISATDFDREGQVIGDEIFLYLDVKKPIYRILLNEWTADEVKKGMETLKLNTEMQNLQDAGISRQWADWMIGINLTSVATVKYQPGQKSILNIGRVLLPTLKIIYDRDQEIEKFKSSTYYKLLSTFKAPSGGTYEGTYYEKDEEKESEKFENKEVLDTLAALLKGKEGTIISKEVEKKKEYAPLLFNLSNLQGHITSKHKGWTSDKVLKVAQSLYEKKFITYPRTGSMALEESLKDRTKKVLEKLKVGLPYEDQIQFATHKRIFDNAKVESHSAIVPTYMIPNSLSADETIVYNAVKNRFMMQFMPVAEFEETKLITKVPELDKGIFVTKGKVQLVEGWRIVEKIESKDTILPQVNQNEKVEAMKPNVSAVTRKPPKAHTEKTLLKIMETCGKGFKAGTKGEETDKEGVDSESLESEEASTEMMASILSGFSIGTPATRAETIKKLKDAGYIKSKGKSLVCTELGIKLVETFPVKQLLDLEYTGRLEKTLSDIEKGRFQKADFINMIKGFTIEAVEAVKKDNSVVAGPSKAPKGFKSIGTCPVCGSDIIETDRAYGCANWKSGCKYTIWKDDKFITALGKEVTTPMVEILLKNGKVGFRNLKSKKGTTFSAYLKYIPNPENGQFKWDIEFI